MDKWDGQDKGAGEMLRWKKEQVAMQDPDVVLVMLGTNDAFADWAHCST